jgi:hypothetical protein
MATNGLDDFEANPCNDDILYVTIAFKCTDLPSIDNSLEIMHLSFKDIQVKMQLILITWHTTTN